MLCRLSHSALSADRLQSARCHIEHYYPADTGGSNLLGGGATAAAAKYIVPSLPDTKNGKTEKAGTL